MEATSSIEWPSRWGRCETATPGTPAGSVTGILGGWVGTMVGGWEDKMTYEGFQPGQLWRTMFQTRESFWDICEWSLTNSTSFKPISQRCIIAIYSECKWQIIQVKRLMLEEPENKCTEEGVEKVVSRIERSFGQMKVKMATDIWYTVVRRLYCKTRLTDQLKWKIFQEY